MSDFNFINSTIHPGLSVIEASAGTGKTYSISHLVARMILDGTVSSIREVLLVTFTNDAAGELAERTRQVLERLNADPTPDEATKNEGVHRLRTDDELDFANKRDRIRQALQDADLLNVSTIHSFCQSILQTEGLLCGLPSMPELIPNADELIDQAVYDLWVEKIAPDPLASAALHAAEITPEANRKFLKLSLPLEKFEPLPQPKTFSEVLDSLGAFPTEFTDEVCDELAAIFDQNPETTIDAPSGGTIRNFIANLRAASSHGDAAFLEACMNLCNAPSWISGRRNPGRTLKAQASSSPAVALCQVVVAGLSEAGWSWLNESSACIKASLEQSLRANRQITYDGLIETLHKALGHPEHGPALAEKIRSRYKVALIDESQDTDARQLEIFKTIFLDSSDRYLVLIGDPKQAIYGFRGADVNTYLEAKKLAVLESMPGEEDRVFNLKKTFRQPENLVRAVNALFRRPHSLLKDGLDFTPAESAIPDATLQIPNENHDARLEVWIAPDGGDAYSDKKKRLSRISSTVASEIVRILNSGAEIVSNDKTTKVAPSDFAVLVSSHIQAEVICCALRELGVPAIQAGGEDILATDEATEILAILRAVNEPRKSTLRYAALTTRLLGRTSADLAALNTNPTELDRLLNEFISWEAHWQTRGLVALLTKIDFDESITERLASNDQGERRITNFRHIMEILSGIAAESGGKPNEVIRWLSQEIQRAKGRTDLEERQLRLESDEEAVKVVTMHASKGLEYNLVFCPFLWDASERKGVQKLNRAAAIPVLTDIKLADTETKLAIARADLEDCLRLAYVAITRAKVKVWIYAGEVCGNRNRPKASPIDWLFRTDDFPPFADWKNQVEGAGRGNRHSQGLACIRNLPEAADVIADKNLPDPNDEHFDSGNEDEGDFNPVEVRTINPTVWRVTSFSQLTREKHAKGDSSKPSADESAPTDPAQSTPNAFASLRGGAALGTAVHDFLETWDFASVPDAAYLEKHFSGYSLGKGYDDITPASVDMLGHLREAVLPALDCSVEEASRTPKTCEWQFHLPAAERFSVAKIAEVFREHGDAGYADSLEMLGSDALEGFLQGFIDKIAAHGTAYGVIDWKTNKLASYDQESLRKAARASHYWLQTHLYLVALQRYLGDQADIRGAWLIYLRGVQSGTPNGILHINPKPELLRGLSNLFAQPNP
jgi:exodeoxyribonuclease V beta subunit